MTKGKLLRSFAWLLLLTAVIWFVVIMYWQVNDIQPTLRSLTLYLGLLPLGTFAAVVLLRQGMASAVDKAARKIEGDATATQSGEAGAVPAPAPVAGPPLGILAGAMRLPAGATADEIERAVAEPRQAGLHKQLKDDAGFPVFASWVEDLDTEAVGQWLDGAVPEGSQRGPMADEQLRALALLEPVMQDLLQVVSAEQLLARSEFQQDVRQRQAPPAPTLVIRLLLATGWNEEVQGNVRSWILAEAGAIGLPATQVRVETLAVELAAEVWAQLDAIARKPVNPDAPDYHLLLACESMIGAQAVARLQQGGQMMSGRNPEGLVPGEGAAGILLVAAAADGSFSRTPQAVIRGLISAQRGVSWQTRMAVRQMSEMLVQTLAFAETEKEKIVALVSDSDHRKSRSAAVNGLAAVEMAHVEPEAACVGIGAACGHLGQVASLAVLALSAARAERENAPVLALLVSEAAERNSAALLPPVKPIPETQAGQAPAA